MADSFLVLVPHKTLHGTISILIQRPNLHAGICIDTGRCIESSLFYLTYLNSKTTSCIRAWVEQPGLAGFDPAWFPYCVPNTGKQLLC